MTQQRTFAGLIAFLAPLLLAGWAMATPLSELGRSGEQGTARSSGQSSSDRESLLQAERPSLGSGSAGSLSGSNRQDGITAIGFAGSAQGQGFAQDWLRVRPQPDAVGDLSALTSFGAPEALVTEDARELEEASVDTISIEELTRLFLEQEARQGRQWRGRPEQGRSPPGQRIDLGLNLVRKLLDQEVEQELAVSVLYHTLEVREYLIQISSLDEIMVFDQAAGQARADSAGQVAASAGSSRAANGPSGKDGPQQIAQSDEGSAVNTLTEFIYEYLLDIRIISLTAVSLALILLISIAVSVSSRRA